MKPTHKELYNRFTHHAPHGDQVDRYQLIRRRAQFFAEDLTDVCPDSRELSLAITHLEEVVFWGNAAIARNEVPDAPK